MESSAAHICIWVCNFLLAPCHARQLSYQHTKKHLTALWPGNLDKKSLKLLYFLIFCQYGLFQITNYLLKERWDIWNWLWWQYWPNFGPRSFWTHKYCSRASLCALIWYGCVDGDQSNDMFASFLDDTMTYSCAIFKVNISPNQYIFSFCTMCYQCIEIHSIQAEE